MKRKFRCCLRRPRAPFPPLIRGGLIEAGVSLPECPPAFAFPPLIRGGLIEAANPAMGVQGVVDFRP